MHTITDLISQRPILKELARFISTLDLHHLALTCQTHRSYIQRSPTAFEVLRRDCLCDGLGLTRRQIISIPKGAYTWGSERVIWQDEPIEVRLYNTKCEVEALPCRKCGINICEVYTSRSPQLQSLIISQECREYPREPPHAGYPYRRPHLNSPWQNENLMCLCDQCDAKLELSLKGKFLNELCDCDVFTRWICRKCIQEEQKWTQEYYRKYTASETMVRSLEQKVDYEEHYGETKVMADHQHDIIVSGLQLLF